MIEEVAGLMMSSQHEEESDHVTIGTTRNGPRSADGLCRAPPDRQGRAVIVRPTAS
jgi:hypothetical protein